MKKPELSMLVGKRSLQDKEQLLQSGTIFVCHMQGMIYIISKDTAEFDETPYCMEVYASEEDIICIYEVNYASLALLEAHEPLQLAKFHIVYLLNAATSSVPLNDIPMRSDIIQAVVHEAGLGWTVDDIQPYVLPDNVKQGWQAWLCVLSRPMYGDIVAQGFLLALYEPCNKIWWVLKPKAIVAPANVQSLSEIQCAFFVPGQDEIEQWKQQEQSEGKPLF